MKMENNKILNHCVLESFINKTCEKFFFMLL